MANISHEIRTPVTSIKGYAETLLDQPDLPKETEQKFLQTILENADHMGDMVTKLLSLSKLDAQIQTALEPVVVQDSLDAALRTLSQRLEERRIELMNEFPDDQVYVLATRAGLFEVMVNLLENAINYGSENMRIFVGATRKNDTVTLYVKDQGPVFPPFTGKESSNGFSGWKADARGRKDITALAWPSAARSLPDLADR